MNQQSRNEIQALELLIETHLDPELREEALTLLSDIISGLTCKDEVPEPEYCEQCDAPYHVVDGEHLCSKVVLRAVRTYQEVDIDHRPAGSYWQVGSSYYAFLPSMKRGSSGMFVLANLSNHKVTFDAQGRITVTPSILVKTKNDDGSVYEWHGFLTEDKWTKV